MICALILDVEGGREFPASQKLAGRAMAVYPLLAAKASRSLARTYLMTDVREIKDAALQYQPIIIDPPAVPGPDLIGTLLIHGAEIIAKELKNEGGELSLLALMFTHAPCVTGELIDSGVSLLKEDPQADSALTVSRYNQWHPLNAMRSDSSGGLQPYLPAIKSPLADVWYPDWGLCLLRPRCLKAASTSAPPGLTPWLGRKPRAILSQGAGPVVSQWEAPGAELWLKKHGIGDVSQGLEPKPKPKPQPAPKGDRR